VACPATRRSPPVAEAGEANATMKLISWNVAGRHGKQPKQLQALAAREPDVIALQEVTRTTAPLWRDALEHRGFKVEVSGERLEDRKNFNVIAARGHVQAIKALDCAYPERVLSARVVTDAFTLELHNVHIVPGSSRGLAKPAQLRAVYDLVARPCPHHRVLCGDFNTPQSETNGGIVVTGPITIPRGSTSGTQPNATSLPASRGTTYPTCSARSTATIRPMRAGSQTPATVVASTMSSRPRACADVVAATFTSGERRG
jgi:endonuclease/exonuclease/phosphatase family metal-dependent hydrolase